MIYKPEVILQLDVPFFGTQGDAKENFVVFHPRVIEVKWTKNHHLAADEMTATIGYLEGGIDPRLLKHARGSMWMWDSHSQVYSKTDHLRFSGICKKAGRRLSSSGWVVDLTFHDYTVMFIDMKPFPSSGMPEWSDTLRAAWTKLCDHTGWNDPSDAKQIISSVKALREAINFDPVELDGRTIGESTSARFLEMSKPSPKQGADAWGVWQWLCGSLGLTTFIDRGECFVTKTSEFYKEEQASMLLYGHHIDDFEETADTAISHKGILLKSFDHIAGRLIESRYPPPSDDRIKKSRATAKRADKEGRDPSTNETSAQYEEFEYHEIQDQALLDARCREAYEEYSRQELKGTVKTAEMFLPRKDGGKREVLALSAGDAIHVGMDDKTRDAIKHIESENDKVRALIQSCGYIPEVARLIARGLGERALQKPVFHIETMEVELGPEKFSVTIKYHNKIFLSGVHD